MIVRVRRSPHGERGLKYRLKVAHVQAIESLSTRRAWIEMCPERSDRRFYMVALLTESVD